jgi:hypothetical protein
MRQRTLVVLSGTSGNFSLVLKFWKLISIFASCVQVYVYSTGGSARPPTVSIPGYVSPTDKGVLFNYWDNANKLAQINYQMPGLAPYVPTSTGGGQPIKAPYDTGFTECLVPNGNWCATSVPGFTDEASCWSVCYAFITLIFCEYC